MDDSSTRELVRVARSDTIRKSKAISLPRAAIEVVVIVGSILLAFGIEAAWSERQERADEREAMAQLSVDFRANAVRLAAVRAMHEEALAASYEILALAGMGGEPTGLRAKEELAYYALRAWTYDPVLGGINSLVQSGRLGILRDDSLRIAVAGWPDLVEDLNGDEVIESTTLFETLAPFLVRKGVMFDVLMSAGALERLEPRTDIDMTPLLEDPVYLQMISWRTNNLESVLTEVEVVDQSIRDILRRLERG